MVKPNIIYEDEDIILINKKAGLLSMPAPKIKGLSAIDLVRTYLKEKNSPKTAHLCHRLDREVSGILLFAKGKKNRDILMQDFKARRIKKEYIAFANGAIGGRGAVIKAAIDGKGASTPYRILAKAKLFTVIRALPQTGRKNQIRLHFKKIGHPLLGDRRFGRGKAFFVSFRRVALHAALLAFNHPVKKNKMLYTCPLAEDMAQLLREYRIKTPRV